MTHFNAKILIIEDTDTIRVILASVLAAAGYDVIEAADGVTGLMLAESADPDLAVLDLHLPDISGLEIARFFHQRLPFFVLTMDSESEPVKKCNELGALGYLVKPPDLDMFLRQVQIALKRGRENLHLRNALRETQVTCKAIGFLMAHHHLSEEASYQKLLEFATLHKQRIVEVASDMFEALRYLQAKADKPAKEFPKGLIKILDLLKKSAQPNA
ncbi:MAG: response regulator [Candidatus Competibacteraceae bacterium]|nr:response regulator [Candidatus Competibacteraceae bacterium]MBK8750992.1 response regulator [Candidatus Competibacteraceae bacterium]